MGKVVQQNKSGKAKKGQAEEKMMGLRKGRYGATALEEENAQDLALGRARIHPGEYEYV